MSVNENIFFKQGELLRQALVLINKRIAKIEFKDDDEVLISKDEVKVVLGIFKSLSLKLYRDTLDFLVGEITKDEWRRHFFSLAHVRTLQDIFARLLHLEVNCANDNKRALTCIAYQLFTYKRINDEWYKKTIALNSEFLVRENFTFPLSSTNLTKSWMNKNDLIFADKNDLLTKENIKKCITYSLEVFGTEKTYEIYSYFSEFLHGNPYFYRGSQHNERFWVISVSLSISSFLIELIDKYTLKKTLPRDFRVWLSEVSKNKKEIVQLWVSETKKHTTE